MRTFFSLLVFILALQPLYLSAQDHREDVVYLKNGTIYRGTIIEQVPNVSYTIEILGGSRILLAATDVEKITKEDKIYVLRKPKPVFHYRDKGYFFLAKVNVGSELGFSIINGYKFGQFGFLGIGVGVDWVYAPIGINLQSISPGDYYSVFVPVFLYYGGDILRKKITPFYNIYAGYGFAATQPNTSSEFSPSGMGAASTVQGGPMGGLGLGARFYAFRHRASFSIAVNVTFQNAIYWNSIWGPVYTYGQYTGTSYSYYSGSVFMIIPTLNFGIGF